MQHKNLIIPVLVVVIAVISGISFASLSSADSVPATVKIQAIDTMGVNDLVEVALSSETIIDGAVVDSVLDQTGSMSEKLLFEGYVTVVKYDADRNEVWREIVKNRFVDDGEEFVLDQVFQDTVTSADNAQIGSICISDAGTITVSETESASDFDGDNGMTETNCKEDTTVTTSAGVATIGPLTFTCGGTNCADDDTVTGIAICQNDVTDDGDFNNCATEGIMFSVIDISDVTLATSETVDITYTFDIVSASQ